MCSAVVFDWVPGAMRSFVTDPTASIVGNRAARSDRSVARAASTFRTATRRSRLFSSDRATRSRSTGSVKNCAQPTSAAGPPAAASGVRASEKAGPVG